MATYQILYWQEIPSLVEARDQNGVKKIQLDQKFQGLIDEVAMRRKFAGTDAYLMEWNKGPKTEARGDAESVSRSVADEIEGRFVEIRNKALEITD